MLWSIILGIISTISTAAFGWAFVTNSKVNVQKQRVDDLKELINVKFEALAEANEQAAAVMNYRLSRIEVALNGSLKRGNN